MKHATVYRLQRYTDKGLDINTCWAWTTVLSPTRQDCRWVSTQATTEPTCTGSHCVDPQARFHGYPGNLCTMCSTCPAVPLILQGTIVGHVSTEAEHSWGQRLVTASYVALYCCHSGVASRLWMHRMGWFFTAMASWETRLCIIAV